MRLSIVAATGGVGRHLLRQALEAGHDVTVVVRSPEKITDGPLTRNYRTAIDRNIRGGFSVSRADVAVQMPACVTRPATIGHTIGVAQ